MGQIPVLEKEEASIGAATGVRHQEAGFAINDLERDSANLATNYGLAFPECFGYDQAEAFSGRLLDHDVGESLERIDFPVVNPIEIAKNVYVKVFSGPSQGSGVIEDALGIVSGHGPCQDQLNFRYLRFDFPVGVDDAQRVLPGIESRDLHHYRSL